MASNGDDGFWQKNSKHVARGRRPYAHVSHEKYLASCHLYYQSNIYSPSNQRSRLLCLAYFQYPTRIPDYSYRHITGAPHIYGRLICHLAMMDFVLKWTEMHWYTTFHTRPSVFYHLASSASTYSIHQSRPKFLVSWNIEYRTFLLHTHWAHGR